MKRRQRTKPFTARKRQATLYKAPASYQARTKVVRVDYKCTDATWNINIGATDNPYSLLANLVRGDRSLDQFDGAKIYPVGLEMKFVTESNPTTTTTTMPCRFIVFQWFDSTVPTLAGILQATGTSASVISAKLLSNRENMTILWDKMFVLNTNAGTGNSINTGLCCKKYITGKRMSEISFASTTAVIQKGEIYACFIADTVTSGNKPFLNGYTRLTFSD